MTMTNLLQCSMIALALLAGTARAEGDYAWLAAPATGDDIERRVPPPAGASRVAATARSFAAWLRHLPLLPTGTAVHLFDGSVKPRQDVHAAVIDIDVGKRDLQQCADAVMRMRAEYLFGVGRPDEIRFHPDPGKPRAIAWTGGQRRAGFDRYLVRVFADAGTASLQAELPRAKGSVQPGDVLIQGGYPGHAVLVLDVAASGDGARRYLLLGQSYMPAQQFHLLKNLGDPSLSPWFDEAALDRAEGLVTPEWRPFKRSDVRRFTP
jgi:hypothetical protein